MTLLQRHVADPCSAWCLPGFQVQFWKAAFQLGEPQHILVPGADPPQVQDFALPLAELHEVPVSSFLQTAEVPLDGSTTLWSVSHFSQFCNISKIAEDAFCSMIATINEDVEHDWT